MVATTLEGHIMRYGLLSSGFLPLKLSSLIAASWLGAASMSATASDFYKLTIIAESAATAGRGTRIVSSTGHLKAGFWSETAPVRSASWHWA